MGTTEHTINDAIARILRSTKRNWELPGVLDSENTKKLKNSHGRPDIIIQEPLLAAITIETEVLPAVTVEIEARSRLGCKITTTGRPILASIAVRLPMRLREKAGTALFNELNNADDLEYSLFTGEQPAEASRWPSSGWMVGSILEISILAQTAAVPPSIIQGAVTNLVAGVSEAASLLDEIASKSPEAIKDVAKSLCQEDGIQTRRMAATILLDAFVFHESLAGATEALSKVRNLDQLRSAGELTKSQLLNEWRAILEVNYWPIFDISKRILESIPTAHSKSLIEKLSETAGILVENQMMRSHDLTGAIFQTLISDRKFLAAYYTTPASAALMAGLVLPDNQSLLAKTWGDVQTVTSLRIADFACGTGTLLSNLYQRLSIMHELHGGNGETAHAAMMAKVLVGCDVLPAAAHLTASMLSGAFPSVVYDSSHIMTLPYGKQSDGAVALGSINLLDTQKSFDILAHAGTKLGGKGATAGQAWTDLPDTSFDFIVMNPPFTRPTGHEGNKVGVPNPMFAAFKSANEEQREMGRATSRITSGTCYHGNAGEGSIFVQLGHNKLKTGGRAGIILPLSVVAGDAWEAVRQLFHKGYSKIIVLSVTGEHGGVMSFSADTGMGECMIIATKENCESKRALFVSLNQTPEFPLIGATMATQINRSIASGNISQLEDGPSGGTSLNFGNDHIGSMIDAPIPSEGAWQIARIADLELAQTAYQISIQGRAWLPTMAESEAITLPIDTLSKIASIGPYHSDVSGMNTNGSIRGPLDIKEIKHGKVPSYPCLWRHTASLERTLSFESDMEAVAKVTKKLDDKELVKSKIAEIWKSASHLHFNQNFQFNSQSTGVQFTPSKTLGGVLGFQLIFKMKTLKRLHAFGETVHLVYWFIGIPRTNNNRDEAILEKINWHSFLF